MKRYFEVTLLRRGPEDYKQLSSVNLENNTRYVGGVAKSFIVSEMCGKCKHFRTMLRSSIIAKACAAYLKFPPTASLQTN